MFYKEYWWLFELFLSFFLSLSGYLGTGLSILLVVLIL